MIHLYGIANCTSVKKARTWLTENHIAHEFHDFKKAAPTPDWVSGCLKKVDLAVLLNKRGTTWRNLSPQQQAQADNLDGAIALMCANPSVIKRPVLLHGDDVVVGFDEQIYRQMFQAA
ncbi:arsenate reductase [Alysiella filiformis]|uniref:Transcriptional regulator, Spx/MgsR family n=1 Tax=Alysiella filiformis DSM 16848 TaxID=1120981 RepID=A0A286E5J8_9NEIS|nr:arsenate reductase [Alysiella filiformis]QMT30380.1 arsenate reductase [Alysiella filiformis]UBQ56640.1 arsenate reductase [Alysiella filiformis DSM 16848]SOD66149.1 transcriptional regulator, Spx/MgsR family [Alysiella filiformis DSM 16848]